MRSLTVEDYYGGYEEKYSSELSRDMRFNAQHTLDMANCLLSLFGERRNISSGWRPKSVNARIPGAAVFSKHLTCQAIDLADRDLALAQWCVDHKDILQNLGLWMEDPRWTIGWTHLQTVAPTSGNRIFIPNSKSPTPEALQLWLPYKDKLLPL